MRLYLARLLGVGPPVKPLVHGMFDMAVAAIFRANGLEKVVVTVTSSEHRDEQER